MNREPSGSQFVRTQLTTLDLTRNQTVTKWNHGALSFAKCRRRRVRANSSGGSISPNGGALLSHEVDRQLGLTDRVARAVGDRRPCTKVRHEVVTMVRQRVHEAALGYEYLNDHDALRHDEAVQTACEQDAALASASTMCRAERSRAAAPRGEGGASFSDESKVANSGAGAGVVAPPAVAGIGAAYRSPRIVPPRKAQSGDIAEPDAARGGHGSPPHRVSNATGRPPSSREPSCPATGGSSVARVARPPGDAALAGAPRRWCGRCIRVDRPSRRAGRCG